MARHLATKSSLTKIYDVKNSLRRLKRYIITSHNKAHGYYTIYKQMRMHASSLRRIMSKVKPSNIASSTSSGLSSAKYWLKSHGKWSNGVYRPTVNFHESLNITYNRLVVLGVASVLMYPNVKITILEGFTKITTKLRELN